MKSSLVVKGVGVVIAALGAFLIENAENIILTTTANKKKKS